MVELFLDDVDRQNSGRWFCGYSIAVVGIKCSVQAIKPRRRC